MTRVAIVDYGLGNLRSVMRGLEKAGATPVITTDAEEIAAADGIVLPGVGAFREGMDQLGPLRETVVSSAGEVPLLGICLGMQMLLEWSEEHGLHRGLGLVPGSVTRFKVLEKVPQIGWNQLQIRRASRLFQFVKNGSFAYYCHSYYGPDVREAVAVTEYGETYASGIERENVWAVQFHPEKSGEVGLRILRNFLRLA